MFDRRHDFDHTPAGKQVFASEYAVFDDPAGQPIQFPGNLKVSVNTAFTFCAHICYLGPFKPHPVAASSPPVCPKQVHISYACYAC